jgi:hypothetical protein
MVTPIRHDDSLTIPTPSLALEFMLEAGLKPPVQIGLGAFGTRIFYEVTGGRAEGPRFKAEVLTGGGDWLLAGSDGLGRRDVRIQFRTDDGAFVYAQYPGLVELTETAMTALATGGSTQFEDQYCRTTPRFETGHRRYAWLQNRVFLSVGRIYNGGVQYRVYRVD